MTTDTYQRVIDALEGNLNKECDHGSSLWSVDHATDRTTRPYRESYYGTLAHEFDALDKA